MGRDTSNRAKGGFATRAIRVGHKPADELGALTPPVFMTSTYAFETAEAGEEIFRGKRQGYVYGRTRNPTQALFKERIASLESAEAGLAAATTEHAGHQLDLMDAAVGRRPGGYRSHPLW